MVATMDWGRNYLGWVAVVGIDHRQGSMHTAHDGCYKHLQGRGGFLTREGGEGRGGEGRGTMK